MRKSIPSLLLVVASGCNPAGSDPATPAAASASSSVSGTIGGKPFTAASAIMLKNPADGVAESKVIQVFEKKHGCNEGPDESERYLDVAITMTGNHAKAEADHLQFMTNAGMDSTPATTGSVEVVSQQPLRVQVNASSAKGDTLTGSVDVVDCSSQH